MQIFSEESIKEIHKYFDRMMQLLSELTRNVSSENEVTNDFNLIYEEINNDQYIIENLYEPFRKFMKFNHKVDYSMNDFITIFFNRYLDHEIKIAKNSILH